MDISSLFTPSGGQQFLLAFTRIGSLFLPLGIPGTSQAPAVARVALGALVTLSLWPQWLHAPLAPDPVWGFLTEAAFGVLVGLTTGAVYIARSRVLARLRDEVLKWEDDDAM